MTTNATPAVTRAVILAAGVGRRLGGTVEAGLPKALLDFNGTTLLARHVGLLRALGTCAITVVVGFGADRMASAIAELDDGRLDTVVNPDFREGSVVSLWTAREVLRAGPVFLMDADVLYDRRLLARLVATPLANCLLLDREIEPGDEPVKLCVSGGRIVDFRKRPTEAHDWHGESVGFFKLDAGAAGELADRVEDYVRTGRRMMEYEEPLRDMIMASDAGRFGFEDISGLPWTEIDFPEDIAKARALLPALVE